LVGLRSTSPPTSATGVSLWPSQACEVQIRLRVPLELDPQMHKAVPNGKLTQPVRVGRVARTDDADAGACLGEPFAPAKQQLQERVGERPVRLEQLPESLRGEDQHLPGAFDHCGHVRPLSCHRGHETDEPTGPLHRDLALLTAVALDHRHASGEDDDQARRNIALTEQDPLPATSTGSEPYPCSRSSWSSVSVSTAIARAVPAERRPSHSSTR
jgi:hypothetical protein